MTDDTVTPVDITDDLDAFSEELFNPKPKAEIEEAPQEEVEDDNLGDDDNPPATDEDNEPDDEPDEGEAEEEEPEPKPKAKKSAKERIDELTAEKHEARREVERLRREFEDFKASVAKKDAPEEASVELRDRLPEGAPNPDALDKNGEVLYPLGEFDPNYIQALARWTVQEENKKVDAERKKVAEQQAIAAEQQKITDAWNEKVAEAAKGDVPDIREHMENITSTFADLDPAYGDYLATTIMVSDVGPQMMEYLSQNIGEAQSIVASGATAATRSLMRLEARLLNEIEAKKTKQEPKSDKIVSKAPNPPEERTRGAGGKFTVAPDTDNLDAFEEIFFQKK